MAIDDCLLADATPTLRLYRWEPKADRWIKMGFAAVAMGIVGWLILHQYIGSPLAGWDTDLPAGLEQARRENRLVVAVIYDSAQDTNYKGLRTVLQKGGNRKAMEDANVIKVHTRLDDEDLLRETYAIKTHPTTLLIAADGTLITRWTGYIPETDFRSSFLKGKAKASPLKSWSTDLAGTFRRAQREQRKVVAVIYDSVENKLYRKLIGTLTDPRNVEAIQRTKVLPVHVWLAKDDPLTEKYGIDAYPASLLIKPNGELITRWSGYIGQTDFRWEFLKGKPRK